MPLYLAKLNLRSQVELISEFRENRVLIAQRRNDHILSLLYRAHEEMVYHHKKGIVISMKPVYSLGDLHTDFEVHRYPPLQFGCTDDEQSFVCKLYSNGFIEQRCAFDDAVIYKGLLYTNHMGRYIGADGWKAILFKELLGIRAIRPCIVQDVIYDETQLYGSIDPVSVSMVIINRDTGVRFFLPYRHQEVKQISDLSELLRRIS